MCTSCVIFPIGFNRRLAACLVLLFVAGAAVASQPQGMKRGEKHESRLEIDQLEDSWRDDVLHKKIAALSSLLSDDYIAITPNGMLQSKEETLASLRSGAVRFNFIRISDRKVRFYGTTALVTSRAEVSGTSPEGDFSGNYRYTRVYARNPNGKWQIVSFEASRIRNRRSQ
jgi:ketosteroid isomerase-like protein